MSTAYVVVEETGEYSDYSKETICVFIDPEKANLYVAAHNERVEFIIKAKNELNTKIGPWYRENPVPRLPNDWDYKLYRRTKNLTEEERIKRTALDVLMNQFELERGRHSQNYLDFQSQCVDMMDYLTDDEKRLLKENRFSLSTDGWTIEEVTLMDL